MTRKDALDTSPFGLCRLIGRTQVQITIALERTLCERGIELNFTQFVALKLIGKHGPITAGDLARILNYNPGALTRLLDKLEQRDLIRRNPSPNDRRALQLSLTPAGKKLRTKAARYVDSQANRIFADVDLTATEREQCYRMLSRVLDGLLNQHDI